MNSGSPLRSAGRIGDALLEEAVLAGEHLLRELVVLVVDVVEELLEERLGAATSLERERVGQLARLGGAARLLGLEGLRVDDGGRHGEDLRADVDDAAEDALLVLELGLVAADRVDGAARELARGTLGPAQVLGVGAELGERARVVAVTDDELRRVPGVELRRVQATLRTVGQRGLHVDRVAGHLEVLVDGPRGR